MAPIPPFEQWLQAKLPDKTADDYAAVLTRLSGVQVDKPLYPVIKNRAAKRAFSAQFRKFRRDERKAITALRRMHARAVDRLVSA
jgi:hypothetical protein